MLKSHFISRRLALKRIGRGVLGTIAVFIAPVKSGMLALSRPPDDFDIYLKQMPQFKLYAPEMSKDGYGIFKIPNSALHKVGPFKEGIVVIIHPDGDHFRLLTTAVKVLKTEGNWSTVIERALKTQPISNLTKSTILLDDLKNSLKRLGEFNQKEVQARFYPIARK